MNLLEKRVRSRFSHRQIYLFPPATFGDFVDIARESLTVPPGVADQEFVDPFNQAVVVSGDGYATVWVSRSITESVPL
jgi:origin recognition complex subunit 4